MELSPLPVQGWGLRLSGCQGPAAPSCSLQKRTRSPFLGGEIPQKGKECSMLSTRFWNQKSTQIIKTAHLPGRLWRRVGISEQTPLPIRFWVCTLLLSQVGGGRPGGYWGSFMTLTKSHWGDSATPPGSATPYPSGPGYGCAHRLPTRSLHG